MDGEDLAQEVTRVRDSVRDGGLLAPPEPVVAMLSGGRDSVCLLDVAVAERSARTVSAVHVNYGLREQADADERHCAALCDALGVGLRVVRERRPRSAAGTGGAGNLQAWAREVRYRAAAQMARERGAVIASGHTASDQVETILYRLAASPGRRALLGMMPSDRLESGERLVRLLLGITREQTAAYCGARGRGSDCCPRCARCIRRRRPTWRERPGFCARRPSCWTRSCRTSWAAQRASRSPAWRSCPRRSRGWSWCGSPRTPPAPMCPRLGTACRSCSRSRGAAAAQSCT